MRNSPHDAFVRFAFSFRSFYIDFFDQLLPARLRAVLDLETLSPMEGSFVTPHLKRYFTDKIFSCKMTNSSELYLTCLIENKSQVPPFIYDQLQAYVAAKHEQDRKEKKPRTPVLPIVLYHGKERWIKKPPQAYYTDLPANLKNFVNAPDYLLIDISTFSRKEIMELRRGYLVNSLILLKNSFNPVYLEHNYKDVLVYQDFYDTTEEGRNFIHGLLVYLLELSNFDEKKMDVIMENIKEPVRSKFRSTAQQLRLAGKLEGKLEGKSELVLQLMIKFPEWSDLFLSETSGLTLEQVVELRKILVSGKNGKQQKPPSTEDKG